MTKQEINKIIEMTKPNLKGKQVTIYIALGYFQKSGANWYYCAGWTNDGDLVVTVHGQVQ